MPNNLINEIENNIDELLIANSFNINNIYEHIKEIAIAKTVNYYFEKSSFDELIDTVLVLEVDIEFTKNIAGYSFKHIGNENTISKLVSGSLKLFDSEMAQVSHGRPASNDVVLARLFDNYSQKKINLVQLEDILGQNRQDFIQRNITNNDIHRIFKSTLLRDDDAIKSFLDVYSLPLSDNSQQITTQTTQHITGIPSVTATGDSSVVIGNDINPERTMLTFLSDLRVSKNINSNIVQNMADFQNKNPNYRFTLENILLDNVARNNNITAPTKIQLFHEFYNSGSFKSDNLSNIITYFFESFQNDNEKLTFFKSLLDGNNVGFDKKTVIYLFKHFENSNMVVNNLGESTISNIINRYNIDFQELPQIFKNYDGPLINLSDEILNNIRPQLLNSRLRDSRDIDEILKLLSRSSLADSEKFDIYKKFIPDLKGHDDKILKLIGSFKKDEFLIQLKSSNIDVQKQFFNLWNNSNNIPSEFKNLAHVIVNLDNTLNNPINMLNSGGISQYITKLQDSKISSDEIYKLLSLRDINVADLTAEAKLNIINNKSFFELLRVNPNSWYESAKSLFTDIVGLNYNINNVSSKYSEILNSVDLSKVDKGILKYILLKHSDYGVSINNNTTEVIKNIIREDVMSVANNSKASELLSTDQHRELVEIGKKYFDIDDTSNWIIASKWIGLLAIIIIVFNKSANAYNFIYYRWYIDKLIKIFKYNDFFTNKVTTKLLKYEDDFKKCSDYGSFSTPFKMSFKEKENIKIQTCFFKYIGATYLFLCKNYKEYLKYKGVKLPDKINEPTDLFGIRDERISIDIKNSLYNMYKIINKFFDPGYKNRLNILFKLTISDNFDISRFEFDDFK